MRYLVLAVALVGCSPAAIQHDEDTLRRILTTSKEICADINRVPVPPAPDAGTEKMPPTTQK